MSAKKLRLHRTKLFQVTRTETVVVSFAVEATSALDARRTPTPADAFRCLQSTTAGKAYKLYSLPGGEQAANAYSRSTNEQGAPE